MIPSGVVTFICTEDIPDCVLSKTLAFIKIVSPCSVTFGEIDIISTNGPYVTVIIV